MKNDETIFTWKTDLWYYHYYPDPLLSSDDCHRISEIRDSASVPSYYLDEEDYISTLQQEDYMNLYDMTCRDCIPDKKLSSNIKACRAVARYYQAATLYKAYVLTGDNLAITRQVQQMEQYAAQTGNYSDYVEKINQLLELDSLHTGETATN